MEDDRAGTWYLPRLAARFLSRARPDEVGVSSDRPADWAYAYVVANGHRDFYKPSPALEEA